MDLHVPAKGHDRIAKSVTRSNLVSVKLILVGTPQDRVYVTLAQKRKILRAVADAKRDIILCFSVKQANHNIEAEEGFLCGILQTAVKCLPSILAGIAAGTAKYHKEGNGMFLGKRDHTYQIMHSGKGLVNTPVEHRKIQGLYVKHDENINRGKGVLHSLFGQIP